MGWEIRVSSSAPSTCCDTSGIDANLHWLYLFRHGWVQFFQASHEYLLWMNCRGGDTKPTKCKKDSLQYWKRTNEWTHMNDWMHHSATAIPTHTFRQVVQGQVARIPLLGSLDVWCFQELGMFHGGSSGNFQISRTLYPMILYEFRFLSLNAVLNDRRAWYSFEVTTQDLQMSPSAWDNCRLI